MAEALTRKQVIQAVWNKFKAIIGNKDISGIGDGTVTGALVGLNGNLTNEIQYREIQIEIGTSLPEGSHSSDAVYVSDEYPSAEKSGCHCRPEVGNQYVCNASGFENNTTMYCTTVNVDVYHVTIIGFY